MKDILAHGANDPPLKSDFTTNKNAFQHKYKIDKMSIDFISEKQDNFRNPHSNLSEE